MVNDRVQCRYNDSQILSNEQTIELYETTCSSCQSHLTSTAEAKLFVAEYGQFGKGIGKGKQVGFLAPRCDIRKMAYLSKTRCTTWLHRFNKNNGLLQGL